jgi:D-alanyl-lipoteichoic acid acyltransferase DltB (MBOAT superfamily)
MMGNASFAFLAFALIVIIVFNLSKALPWRQAVLLIASLVFLSFFSHDIGAWIPFGLFLACGFISVRALQRGFGRIGFVPIVVACIAAFIWLKKYTFIPSPLLLPFPYVTLGLSYIFFRVLHLIIDAHSGEIGEPVALLTYLNYTLNFTTLISGPIQRYQEFVEYQLAPNPMPLDAISGGRAVERIIIGFFKLNVLSLLLSMLQSHALNALHADARLRNHVLNGVLIVGSYPLYLYCNFSGYIDIVIGIARFLRIRLPENFDRPFSSDNFMVFWSRWHITLSQWLKTYVYNPLLMASMRRYTAPNLAPYLSVFAIFVTFFLVGVWHGQTSVFLFFGVLQGGGVAGVQLYQLFMTQALGRKRFKGLSSQPVYVAFARGLTFTWFAFTLLWFWSNWSQIGSIGHALRPAGILGTALTLFVVATLVLWLWETLRAGALRMTFARQPVVLSRYVHTAWATAVAVVSIATVLMLNAPAPDIVYKAF